MKYAKISCLKNMNEFTMFIGISSIICHCVYVRIYILCLLTVWLSYRVHLLQRPEMAKSLKPKAHENKNSIYDMDVIQLCARLTIGRVINGEPYA